MMILFQITNNINTSLSFINTSGMASVKSLLLILLSHTLFTAIFAANLLAKIKNTTSSLLTLSSSYPLDLGKTLPKIVISFVCGGSAPRTPPHHFVFFFSKLIVTLFIYKTCLANTKIFGKIL
jgi:hypothetical protein